MEPDHHNTFICGRSLEESGAFRNGGGCIAAADDRKHAGNLTSGLRELTLRPVRIAQNATPHERAKKIASRNVWLIGPGLAHGGQASRMFCKVSDEAAGGHPKSPRCWSLASFSSCFKTDRPSCRIGHFGRCRLAFYRKRRCLFAATTTKGMFSAIRYSFATPHVDQPSGAQEEEAAGSVFREIERRDFTERASEKGGPRAGEAIRRARKASARTQLRGPYRPPKAKADPGQALGRTAPVARRGGPSRCRYIFGSAPSLGLVIPSVAWPRPPRTSQPVHSERASRRVVSRRNRHDPPSMPSSPGGADKSAGEPSPLC